MGTLFYDLPVTDGKSGSWTLDTFTISQEKAHMLSQGRRNRQSE